MVFHNYQISETDQLLFLFLDMIFLPNKSFHKKSIWMPRGSLQVRSQNWGYWKIYLFLDQSFHFKLLEGPWGPSNRFLMKEIANVLEQKESLITSICFVLMGLTGSFWYLVIMEHPLEYLKLIFLNGQDLLLCVLKSGGTSHK